MLYLIVLGVVAALYLTDVIDPRKKIVTVPTAVLWFGALGGVTVSLQGVFDHDRDWKSRFVYWHIARPFVGATVAVIAVLIFQSGILAATGDTGQTDPGPASNAFYYVLAFFIGYNERAFRELMTSVGTAIIRPGERREDEDEEELEEVEEENAGP